MISRLTSAFAMTLILASGAYAQTAEAPAEAPTEPAIELDLGTPVEDPSQEQPAPQVGEEYAKEQFGDWTIRCVVTENGEDPCTLYQLLVNENEQPVAEFSMLPLPNGGEAVAGATIVAPLETLLPQGLRLSIDGSQPRQYAFQFCNPVGCVVRLGLTADFVAQFKRGNAGKVRIVPANDPQNPVELTVSLTGFTAAYDSLTK